MNIIGISEGKGGKYGAEETFKVKMVENFLKSMTDTKIWIQETENSKQDNFFKKNLHLGILYSKNRKPKTKKTFLEKLEGKNGNILVIKQQG